MENTKPVENKKTIENKKPVEKTTPKSNESSNLVNTSCKKGQLSNDRAKLSPNKELPTDKKVITGPTNKPKSLVVTASTISHRCQRIIYGVENISTIDVTNIIKKFKNIDIIALKTNKMFGDPYPKKEEKTICLCEWSKKSHYLQ